MRMISVKDARAKAQTAYKRNAPSWAARVARDAAGAGVADAGAEVAGTDAADAGAEVAGDVEASGTGSDQCAACAGSDQCAAGGGSDQCVADGENGGTAARAGTNGPRAGGSPNATADLDECWERLPLAIALHPPTEKDVLADTAGTRQWAQSWHEFDNQLDCARHSADGARVAWEPRNWPSVGRQEVPVHLELATPGAVAACAHRERDWQLTTQRAGELGTLWRSVWAVQAATASGQGEQLNTFSSAVARIAPRLAELEASDWRMLVTATTWLVAHPDLTCFVRELPIPGIHTKWVERNKPVLYPLVAAILGREPVFRTAPALWRIHALDDACAPGGLRDFSTSADELCRSLHPERVIICENLATTLALPDMPGTIAVHGGGYRVVELAAVSWLHDAALYYWGDLDSHGFAILNALRHHFPHAVSVLMDVDTLEEHRVFCVDEPTPCPAELDLLTDGERRALAALAEGGRHLRLEQERIGWPYALSRIEQAMGGSTGL